MSVATSVKKAARKVEKAVTGTEPEADLLDTLKEEHEEVAALLKKLTDDDASASERRKLVTQIKAALVPHVKAEQKVLYDAIIALKDKDAQKDGEEGYIEHALASKTLADKGSSTFNKRCIGVMPSALLTSIDAGSIPRIPV